ncbi:MAG: protein kinase [Acidobacteriota bacterium]|nr:protein kinase [Blastocatellia bacterium]MDW8240282.1 protein kinase [Acidobacteriota bacterium]
MDKQILHYRILSQLGEGGGGTVYKAEDTKLKRTVVIKVLARDLALDPTGRQRFLREARLASALDHPNICTIYEINEIEGTFFIVMQFVEGKTLKEILAKGPLDLKSALAIAIQLADALTAAHERGIVHRDMKSANIIITPEGQCKILDFGLAKQYGEGATGDELTMQGALLGTPSFMSPEQARGERVDFRSDIFSLGIIMYEMMTGERPFKGRSRVEILQSVIAHDPPPMSQFNRQISPELEQIVRRALAKDRQDRYARTRDLLNALKQVAREQFGETGMIPGEMSAHISSPQHLERPWFGKGLFNKLFGKSRRSPGSVETVSAGTPAERTVTPSEPSISSWTTKERKTLAILPFKNLGADPASDFYGFSLADSVITELAKVQSLVVTPSSYIARYQHRDIDPREAGRELSVDAVLVGSFLSAGTRFRVTPQLVDIVTGEILWTDKIDVDHADIITLQDAIAGKIVTGLKVKLSQAEQEQMNRPTTTSPEAYEAMLRGKHLQIKAIYQTYSKDDLDGAVQMFKEAIALDPQFAQAYAGLGRCYANYVIRSLGGVQYYELAESVLQKALELDDGLIDARIHLVYIYLFKGQKEKARQEVSELLQRAPNDATVHAVAANLYRWDGLYEAALQQYNIRISLFPVAAPEGYSGRARIFTYQGRYERALEEFNKGLAIEPHHAGLKAFMAETLFYMGRIDEAMEMLNESLAANPNVQYSRIFLAMCYAKKGEPEKAREMIDEKVETFARADGDGAFWLGSIFALLGQTDEAIQWLTLATRIGYENFPWFERNPNLDPIRQEPRFIELMDHLRARWEQLAQETERSSR